MTEVTCAIIVKQQLVLVTQRSHQMPHPLKWEFPGGKIKEGETAESCIKREIKEELGVDLIIERPLPYVTYSYDSHTIILIPFLCTLGEGPISLSEHLAFQWLPFSQLDQLDWLEADVEVVEMLKTSGVTGDQWS
jgi:8-oxo-dGTP diphosphatase